MKLWALVASLGLIAIVVCSIWLLDVMRKPGDFTTQQIVFIQPGSSGKFIMDQLASQNILTPGNKRVFYAMLRFNHTTIKAGEYEIPPHSSLIGIVAILGSGKSIQHQFTLAEGLTVKQALILLNREQALAGNVTVNPAEGSLLPDTYSFTRGDQRDDLIRRMQTAHTELLDKLWEARDPSISITTKEEAVTLASIVEKETGVPAERAKIAGLFYNRLKAGMPLQTDPTVVYIITDKLGHMGGKPMFSKYLEVESPYNTYKHAGLPPGPIANPGKASIEAVLHPEQHNYLYFVADGSGGHVFSETLAEHNKNVTEWRKIKKELNAPDKKPTE